MARGAQEGFARRLQNAQGFVRSTAGRSEHSTTGSSKQAFDRALLLCRSTPHCAIWLWMMMRAVLAFVLCPAAVVQVESVVRQHHQRFLQACAGVEALEDQVIGFRRENRVTHVA